MTDKPDDKNKPENEGDKDNSEDEGDSSHEIRLPDGSVVPGAKRQIKVVLTQSAQEVKFADTFGFTLSPLHGIVKFGVMHPETGEFIVHTQIAMTPQGLISLSGALQQNIERARKQGGGKNPKMN